MKHTIFGNLGCHIIKTPRGNFTFVGSVPRELCDKREATTSDVMGGRAVRENGELVCYRPKVFNTELEARDFANYVNISVA